MAQIFRSYPRQITAAIAGLLLCAGGGAFAVASLVPDPADMPVRQVFEAATPLSVTAQTDALDAHKFTLFRNELTRSSDTAEALLKRLGLVDAAAAAFVRSHPEARIALLGKAGRTVTAEATHDNTLQKLSARWIPDGDNFKRYVIEKVTGGFRGRIESDVLTPGSRLASGIVRSTLFAATDDAGIPDAVAGQLADIFQDDAGFRSVRKGDRFAVVYETFEADGQTLRTGRVLSAEFERGGKATQAMWFQEPGQKGGGYYRPNGTSLRKAYLASPVEFSRITSGFAARLHPILNSWRQHNGIDYAAPTGTPVRSVGDGVVEFAGTQSGYGNIVIVKHRNNQSTVYAHLSQIDVKVGQNVNQSQTVGAVGSTGWSTGPHLHFEYRINGEYVDPAVVGQNDSDAPITANARPAFDKVALATRTELAAAFSVVQASAD